MTGSAEPSWRGGYVPAELNRFVGRRELLASARAKLGDPRLRLLSLTGGGGTGKTRLAVHLAHAVRRSYADGVWWVDLASVTDTGMVGRAVLDALPVDDISSPDSGAVLTAALAGREALLILDNCEHLAAGVAPLVVRLLTRCPRLRILATSRVPLRCPGEHLLDVPPMSTPTDPDHAVAREYEAVRLFEERAAAVREGFTVGADNAADAGRLVRLLDGVPLAIELAAPLVRSMALPEIVSALSAFRLGLLTDGPHHPGHHRTLWHTFEWSHQLCSPEERLLWARLAVFAGGFTMEAAVAVAGDPGLPGDRIPALLRTLVTKSVVTADTDAAPTRYSMLATVREYGLERLRRAEPPLPDPRPDPSGDEVAARRRFSRYYGEQATRHGADWYGPDESRYLWEAAQDLPNYRAILDRCADATTVGEAEAGARIASALTAVRLWFFAGTLGEGLRALLRTDEALRRTGGPSAARLTVLAKAGWMALCLGEDTTAAELLTACRSLADPAASEPGGEAALANLGFLTAAAAMLTGTAPVEPPTFAAVGADLAAAGDGGTVPMADLLGAIQAAFAADRHEAIAVTEAHLADARARGARWTTSWAQWARALAELRHGEAETAAEMFRAVLRAHWDIGDRWGSLWCLEALGWTSAALGRHEAAAPLLGAASAMQRRMGVRIGRLKPWAAAHTACVERVRTALGAGYEAAERRGADMPIEHAIDMALGHRAANRADTPAPARSPAPVLSEKQRAVAELIADGRTDKQIASALFLSPRTVHSHVGAILRRLGFGSRTEIAKWVLEQRR
ncbi:ATP-binding protein [Actinoallomurus iriomotensis]|uniref:LuxR family transcriptional regulator n=1 Tax=Actinoallomurus iriomotensis TaxID=478107 RepID=A0A9W6R9R1_9ACTN|nr:LuxR C-terminal-related transcriptional regulator [Actinoallomurus iriomotensis]GLY71866.1 LuxR family transcriptional regulator [Actinoallomurus iriomotensis]